MRRGEVWWVRFRTGEGGEMRNDRPAVIVSNDASNNHLNRLQVVPLTSKVLRVYPSEALVRVRRKKHKAMADQLATVTKSRLTNRLGSLSHNDIKEIERAMRIQLDLP